MSKPRKLLTISEQIACILVREILEGKIKFGDKLPSEVCLAEEFEVSRPTVRKALSIMEEQKFIFTQVGREGGHFVNSAEVVTTIFFDTFFENNKISALDIEQARIAIGIQSSRLVALHRTEDDLQDLCNLLPQMENIPSSEEVFQIIYDFHSILARATHNQLLEFILTLMLPLERLISTRYYLYPQQRIVISKSLHLLYDCICEKNSEKIEQEMCVHFSHFRPTVEEFYVNGYSKNLPQKGKSQKVLKIGRLEQILGADWLTYTS